MVRLFTVISLILALVLFPPATLALISNNAVPGDATYPIKRSLEDIIFAIASANPVSKAWFAAARSDRRFKELKTLVAQGKKTSETLNELVEQTNVAASQIALVTNSTEKAKLIEQLSQSIDKYDQALIQFTPPTVASESQPAASTSIADNSVVTTNPAPQDTPPLPHVVPLPSARPISQTQVPAAAATLAPTSKPVPAATIAPTPIPKPTPIAIVQATPIPTQAPQPNPVPAPTLTTDRVRVDDEERREHIEEARRRLEEIKKQLREESIHRDGRSKDRVKLEEEERDNKRDDENKTDKNNSRKSEDK